MWLILGTTKKTLDFTFTDSLLVKCVISDFQNIKRQRQLSKRVPISIFYLQSVGDVSLVASLLLSCVFSVVFGATLEPLVAEEWDTSHFVTNEKTRLFQALTYILI